MARFLSQFRFHQQPRRVAAPLPALAVALLLLAYLGQPLPASASPDQALADFDAFNLDASLAGLQAFEAEYGPTERSVYTRARIAAVRSQIEQTRSIAADCRRLYPDSSLCLEAEGEGAILEVIIGGNVLELLGAVRATKKAWERAVELDPDNTRASLLLLRFYRQVPWIAGGSTAKARQLEQEIARRNPPKGEEAAGLNAMFDEDYARAVTHFQAAHRALPADRDPQFNLAMAYTQAKDWPNAWRAWREMSVAYPRFWRVWLQLGLVAVRGNLEPAAGRAALDTYLDNDAYAPDVALAQAHYGIGVFEQQAGNLDAAIAHYRQALQLDDDHKLATEALTEVCRQVPSC